MKIKSSKLFFLLLFSLLFACNSESQNYIYPQNILLPYSAEAWGVGGASVSSQNVMAVFNNPAAYSDIQKFQCGIYSDQRFSQTKIISGAAAIVIPARVMNIGFAASHFGDSIYNQEKIGISVSRHLSKKLSLGATMSYMATYKTGDVMRGNILGEIGLHFEATEKLKLGLFIFNPSQSVYSVLDQNKIPTFVRLGAGYEIADNTELLIEAQQGINQPLILRGGVKYKFNSLFSAAAGIASNPVYLTFGLSLRLKNTRLDYAAGFHEILGYAPHLGIIFPEKSE